LRNIKTTSALYKLYRELNQYQYRQSISRMNTSSVTASGTSSDESGTTPELFELTSNNGGNVSPFDSNSWCTATSTIPDPEKVEKLRQEEASRLADQIEAIVQIDKEMAGIGMESNNGSDHSTNAPDATDNSFNELTEIRENHDLWHYSPVIASTAVTAGGHDVRCSPPGLPMPAPFAPSPSDHRLDGLQGMESVQRGQHGHTLTDHQHQKQIQNAYALTPKMPAMDGGAVGNLNRNLYQHATPKVVYEDHNAMVMMVEELDIEEPALPRNVMMRSLEPALPPRNARYNSYHGNDRRSSLRSYHGSDQHAHHGNEYSQHHHISYGHSHSHSHSHHHYQHGKDEVLSGIANTRSNSRIPRHRAEAIRESDIPPRFRKRKAARDRTTSFHTRRSKVHSSMSHGHVGNGHNHGPWYRDPVSSYDVMNNEHTSIHELVRRYNHQ